MMWMIASVPFWASGLFCVRGAIRCLHTDLTFIATWEPALGCISLLGFAGILFFIAAKVAS